MELMLHVNVLLHDLNFQIQKAKTECNFQIISQFIKVQNIRKFLQKWEMNFVKHGNWANITSKNTIQIWSSEVV